MIVNVLMVIKKILNHTFLVSWYGVPRNPNIRTIFEQENNEVTLLGNWLFGDDSK